MCLFILSQHPLLMITNPIGHACIRTTSTAASTCSTTKSSENCRFLGHRAAHLVLIPLLKQNNKTKIKASSNRCRIRNRFRIQRCNGSGT